MRLDIAPGSRMSTLVWRQYPSTPGDPGWRVAPGLNGCPIGFVERFDTWQEAMGFATDRGEVTQ